MQEYFFKLVKSLVSKCFAHLNLNQKKNLSDLMTAFLSHIIYIVGYSVKLGWQYHNQTQTINLFFG